METYTDIVIAEAERRQRAYQYERALGNLANVKRAIEKLEPVIEHCAAQVQLLETVEGLVASLDPKIYIDGSKGGLVQEGLLALTKLALKDQRQRLARDTASRAAMIAELPRMEATVKEFES